MVKRPDNAIACVDLFMKDGRYAFNKHLLVKDLRDFFRRSQNEISWICFDIQLTTYFWSKKTGWKKQGRYFYTGGNRVKRFGGNGDPIVRSRLGVINKWFDGYINPTFYYEQI